MKKENINFEKGQNYKRTIEKFISVEYIEKRSKFIAHAFPVANEIEVKDNLEFIRKIFSNANHNCFAFVIGIDRTIYRYNDDGEPSGTAGKPIYQTILNFDLTDVLVVVSRFFGGIKLGASGLIRAYKTATKLVLERANIIEIPQEATLLIEIDYQNYSKTKALIYSELSSIHEIFKENVKIYGKIPLHSKDDFIDKLFNILSGRVVIKEV